MAALEKATGDVTDGKYASEAAAAQKLDAKLAALAERVTAA